jgi:hypothetical protein
VGELVVVLDRQVCDRVHVGLARGGEGLKYLARCARRRPLAPRRCENSLLVREWCGSRGATPCACPRRRRAHPRARRAPGSPRGRPRL